MNIYDDSIYFSDSFSVGVAMRIETIQYIPEYSDSSSVEFISLSNSIVEQV